MTPKSWHFPESHASSFRTFHRREVAMAKQAQAARLEGSRWTPYIFIAPVAVYLLVFQGYPLLQELILSFTSTSLLSPSDHAFVGMRNYGDLVGTTDFHQVLLITAIYTVACVVLSIGLGLVAALLLNGPIPGRGFARAMVTIPWAAPPVAVALIFTWMLNAQYGIFNRALRALGFAAGAGNWLDNASLALPAILITTIWQIFPFASVVILSALQGVSEELRDAAVIDGADRLSVFRAVVWPTIQPSVMLLALFITIWSLRRFDLIWLMTQGGPIGATNTLVIELYRRAFVYRDLGQAAAVGMVGLAIAIIVTMVYFRLTLRGAAAFPLYWMFVTSLTPSSELFASDARLLPKFSEIGVYRDAFHGTSVTTWVRNSAIVAVGTTLVSLALAIFPAYALSRFRFRGMGLVGFGLFITQMLPEAMLVVPLYAIFGNLALLNTLGGLILANSAFTVPVITWILKGAIDGVPIDIEEAARIDGCSRLDIVLGVVLPLVAPTLAAAAVIAFFHGWNEYIFAQTLISDQDLRTASVGLAGFVGELSTPVHTVMAIGLMYTLPAVIFYLFVQRFVVAGMTAGSVKG